MLDRQVGDVGTGDGSAQESRPGSVVTDLRGCLAIVGVIAALFVVPTFVQPLLGGLLYRGLALHEAPDWYDLAPQYWLFVAVGVLPGLLGLVVGLLSARPDEPRAVSRTSTAGMVGVGWTSLWVVTMFGGRVTDVSAGEVSIKYGVSLSGAAFLRDAAEPVGAALPFFVVGLVLTVWLVSRPVRQPWRVAAAGVLVVAVVLVGRTSGGSYL